MTFAIVRNGRIVDHVDAATLVDLDTWLAGRRGPLAILHVRPGETVRVGARVDVEEIEIGVATLAARRRAPVGAARTGKATRATSTKEQEPTEKVPEVSATREAAADAGRIPT